MRRYIILPVLALVVVGLALLVTARIDVGWSTDDLTVAVPIDTPRVMFGGGSAERLTVGPGRPATDTVGSWPGFRGPARDNIAPDDGVTLQTSWTAPKP